MRTAAADRESGVRRRVRVVTRAYSGEIAGSHPRVTRQRYWTLHWKTPPFFKREIMTVPHNITMINNNNAYYACVCMYIYKLRGGNASFIKTSKTRVFERLLLLYSNYIILFFSRSLSYIFINNITRYTPHIVSPLSRGTSDRIVSQRTVPFRIVGEIVR